MASNSDLVSLLEGAQKNFLKSDEEEQKRKARQQADEQKKLKQVEASLQQGRSWEDIANKTGLSLEKIRSYSQQTRPDYGIKPSPLNRLGDNLMQLGYTVGKGIAEGASNLVEPAVQNFKQLTGSTSTPEQRQAILNRQADAQKRYDRLSPEDKARVDEALNTVRDTSGLSGGSDVGTQAVQDALAKGESGKKLETSLNEVKQKLKSQARQNVGRAAEAASMVVGGGGLLKAAQLGTKQLARTAATTTGSGVVGGAGSELVSNPDADISDIGTSAAIGGALGLGADLATAAAGKIFKFGKEPINSTKIEVQDLSTPTQGVVSRELPKATIPTRPSDLGYNDVDFRLRFNQGALEDVQNNPGVADAFLKTGSRDPLTLVTQHLADATTNSEIDSTITRLLPDIEARNAKLLKAQIRSAKTPQDVAHALWDAAKRDEVRYLPENAQGTPYTQKISFSDTVPELEPINQELNKVDNEIVVALQSGDKTKSKALNKDRIFLEEEAAREAASVESARILEAPATNAFEATGKTRTSRLAKNTEAKAIKEKLTKGFEDLPTFQGMNMDDQAARVVDFMDKDYETAKRIALGEVQPPAGVAPGSFYKGVEARAAREGDVDLLERLATESTIPKQASLQGQQIASLAYRDPESPVTAFKAIADARKASPLSIPRTISPDESKRVVELAKKVADAKAAIANGGDRLAYGRARIAYDDYVNDLIAAANKKTLKDALSHPIETTINAAGLTKSLVASLDNSSLLRQGWKILFTHPGTWAKNSAKTFVDFVKAVGNKNAINGVRADIMSRPNSLNGMYKKMGVDLFGIREEAFPTSLPGKIPIAGRLFKGSEAAYTGFIQRTRADLADKYLEIAQKSGVDLTSKKELKAIGKFVNALTSRGYLGRVGERASSVLNNVFFSPRLLKSNIDVLTAHQFQRGVTPFVRKRAARNLLQIAIGSAAAIKLASEVTGAKVEWDPRSSNFGKIKIGDTRFDLSGGLASLATLGARIATRSSKSSASGEVQKLNSGEFGAATTLDTVYNFFENKTSPALSAMRDYLKGETFEGDTPTVGQTIKDLTLPLIIGSYQELKDNPRAASVIPSLIAEGLGISVNTYGLDSNWNANNSKKVTTFKQRVDENTFKKANKDFNARFNAWYDKVASREDFWRLPQEKRESLVTSKKNALTDDVLKENGFIYKEKKVTDNSTKQLINELKKY